MNRAITIILLSALQNFSLYAEPLTEDTFLKLLNQKDQKDYIYNQVEENGLASIVARRSPFNHNQLEWYHEYVLHKVKMNLPASKERKAEFLRFVSSEDPMVRYMAIFGLNMSLSASLLLRPEEIWRVGLSKQEAQEMARVLSRDLSASISPDMLYAKRFPNSKAGK